MKRALKKTLYGALFFFEFVISFLSLYFTLAIICSIVPVNEDTTITNGVKIYIKSNGVHTDLCLPVVTDYIDWRTFIPTKHFPKITNHSYVSIGWGDKGFFLETPTWADLKFSTVFNAAFTGSETAMHVAYHDNEPHVTPNSKLKLIEPKKYIELIDYIKDSFKLDKEKIDLIPNKGYWQNDNFYEAKGAYHLFNTCNAWTNEGLKIAGVRTAWLALFSDGIMRHLD